MSKEWLARSRAKQRKRVRRQKRQRAVPMLLETLVNVLLVLLPKAPSEPIRTTAIKAAIRPYSMAVAPASDFKRLQIFFNILSIPLLCAPDSQ